MSLVMEVPTVKPAADFDAQVDAVALRGAMKGFGTDENTLIQILCKRSYNQRLLISTEYTREYNRNLENDLKSELSGEFRNLMVALMEPPFEYLAKQLHKSMDEFGADKQTIVEILCGRSKQDVQGVADAYEKLYGLSLTEKLRKDTSDDFRGLLKRIVIGIIKKVIGRHPPTGEGAAANQEHVLKLVTPESKSEDIHIPAFFAERLHTAMAGLGTDDATLIRIIVSRCEIDLGNIKSEYSRLYNEQLVTAVKNDTSGDYQKGLVVLIG